MRTALKVRRFCTYSLFFFFFNATATTEIYTLSLHDALPICSSCSGMNRCWVETGAGTLIDRLRLAIMRRTKILRSEEHTSELQSLAYLVCRLLLEKKKRSIYYFLNIAKATSLSRC